jgi:hypothetical protein
VLDRHGRLYLRRYFEHERRLAETLRGRALAPFDVAGTAALRQALDRLFPRGDSKGLDAQRLAAEVAVLGFLNRWWVKFL